MPKMLVCMYTNAAWRCALPVKACNGEHLCLLAVQGCLQGLGRSGRNTADQQAAATLQVMRQLHQRRHLRL
jgi:hypothetical protein